MSAVVEHWRQADSAGDWQGERNKVIEPLARTCPRYLVPGVCRRLVEASRRSGRRHFITHDLVRIGATPGQVLVKRINRCEVLRYFEAVHDAEPRTSVVQVLVHRRGL